MKFTLADDPWYMLLEPSLFLISLIFLQSMSLVIAAWFQDEFKSRTSYVVKRAKRKILGRFVSTVAGVDEPIEDPA